MLLVAAIALFFVAAAFGAGIMLSDCLALSFKVPRNPVAVSTAMAAIVVTLFALVAGTLWPFVFLLRCYAVVFIVIGALHGRDAAEYDHLWVPLMGVPVYFAVDVLYTRYL